MLIRSYGRPCWATRRSGTEREPPCSRAPLRPHRPLPLRWGGTRSAYFEPPQARVLRQSKLSSSRQDVVPARQEGLPGTDTDAIRSSESNPTSRLSPSASAKPAIQTGPGPGRHLSTAPGAHSNAHEIIGLKVRWKICGQLNARPLVGRSYPLPGLGDRRGGAIDPTKQHDPATCTVVHHRVINAGRRRAIALGVRGAKPAPSAPVPRPRIVEMR